MAVTNPPELEETCHLPLAFAKDMGNRLEINTNRFAVESFLLGFID
jgi:hypothetical protein